MSHTGYGPVRIGQSRLEAESALNAALPLDTLDMVTEGCGHVAVPGVPGVMLMVYEDTIVRIEVHERGTYTFAGDQVGDLEADVLHRHRGAARVEPHPYDFPEGHYVVVPMQSDSSYQLIFETDGTRVTSYRAGRLPPIAWIEGCL